MKGKTTFGRGAVGAARRWFLENPSEYLTLEDMVEKFGFKNIETAQQGVYTLKLEGLLATAHIVFADPERPRF